MKHASGLYAYHQGQLFSPGVQSAVFEPAFGLPIQTLSGKANYMSRTPSPLQGPKIWASNVKPLTGLGGYGAGFLNSPGPLMDKDE